MLNFIWNIFVQLITLKELSNKLKLDRNTIYQLIKLKQFPKPILLGKRKYRWDIKDIELWINNAKSN